MSEITRRQFHTATLATLGAAAFGGPASAGEEPKTKIPTVLWGKYDISRVLVGHNPVKGQSHFSKELDKEMHDYFAGENVHGRQMLQRCEEFGINTCQMGSPMIEEMFRRHYAEGGKIQWIATFYSCPAKAKRN